MLKGAVLFTLWTGKPHRATRDIDLLGLGDSDEAHLREVFAEVLATAGQDDGVTFDLGSLRVGPIREGQEYGGVRVEVIGRATSAQVPLLVDIGFGDAITPVATIVPFVARFSCAAPAGLPARNRGRREARRMVQLGMANSRMKDFYDLVILARLFEFDGALLARAIRATFDRRRTPLPQGLPVALQPGFAEDASKRSKWAGFVRKTAEPDAGDLKDAIVAIAAFVQGASRSRRGGHAHCSVGAGRPLALQGLSTSDGLFSPAR